LQLGNATIPNKMLAYGRTKFSHQASQHRVTVFRPASPMITIQTVGTAPIRSHTDEIKARKHLIFQAPPRLT